MNNEFGSSKPTIKDSVQTLVDQGSETVGTIKNRVGDAADSVKQGGAAARERTTNYIQANPLKSLVIAFGLGYVAMRVRTSPLFKVALISGLGYLAKQFIGRDSSAMGSSAMGSSGMDRSGIDRVV